MSEMDELDYKLSIYEEFIEPLINSEMRTTIEKSINEIGDISDKISFAEKVVNDLKFDPNIETYKLRKDSGKSEKYRNEGLKFYKEKKYQDALRQYNRSLCYAPSGSANLGLTYAYRSAAYLKMENYDKALENIELARNHNYPKDQLDKLRGREEKCVKLMNNKPQKNDSLIKEKIRNEVLQKQFPGNKRAPGYIADCLELKKSPEFGRHIVTNKDLEVGTVIAIEEPFSKSVLPKTRFDFCANCLARKMQNFLPCDSCCVRMFCSENCKKMAWEKFHQYECGVADVLDQGFDKNMHSALGSFFEALSIFNGDPAALNNFLQSIEDSEATIFDFDFSTMSDLEKKKALLEVTHALSVSKTQHSSDTVLRKSFDCAILSVLMAKHTILGSILNEEGRKMFQEFIYKHSIIAATNVSSSITVSEMFLFNALLNHSCAPNVTSHCFVPKNHVIVKRPIKAGEQIFDDYGFLHVFNPLAERQAKLMEKYGFTCRCVACQSPAKFPRILDLNHKDPNYHSFIMPNVQNLYRGKNFENVPEIYKIFCRYLQVIDQFSPCMEIFNVENYAFKLCFSLISDN